MVATLEKVWGSASWSPGHTGDQNQGPPFPECFSHFPGFVFPILSAWSYPKRSRLVDALHAWRTVLASPRG